VYSRERRMKAVELYIKYDQSAAAVVHELGYPSCETLPVWYQEFIKEKETGVLHDRYRRESGYTLEQRRAAVKHYLEHGRCLSRSVRALGYPNKGSLRNWCDTLAPDKRKRRAEVVQFTQEQKREAVVALCSRRDSARKVAEDVGATRALLYKWKLELLGKEEVHDMSDKDEHQDLPEERDRLLAEVETLKKKIRRLKMENDILEGTAALLKKDPGVDPDRLTNQEKAMLVGALRSGHPISELLDGLDMARSSYYYQRVILAGPCKYESLSIRIIELFNANKRCYGYRRIHYVLAQEGIRVSEKVVRALMATAGLAAIGKRKRKYNSYQGEIAPAPENLLERDFHADLPNIKWLTDITEFHIPAGKVYLSPIVDCFDGLLVSWTISTHPDAELVNGMLDLATTTLKAGECPILHSDRGCHYRWPGWVERIERSGLIRSMSKKGCSPDNSACEGLFGRIKNEMFYNRSWAGFTMDEFLDILNRYLHWYNAQRVKMSLGGLSPVEYRINLGYAA
jgi:putative transposase